MQVTPIPVGAHPSAWLIDQVAHRRARDALAPVTVVLPSAGAALATRRALGRSGTVNVHCTMLPRVAEALGAQRLASTGYSPLTPLMELAVGRHLLNQPAAGDLRSATPHRALVESLVASIRRLRQQDLTESDRQAIAARGQLPQTLIALLHGYESLLDGHLLFDGRDLLEAAAASVAGGSSLDDIGPLIVQTPVTLSPGQVRLLHALDERTVAVVALIQGGPPEAAAMADRIAAALGVSPPADPSTAPSRRRCERRLVTAPSAVEEVRLAVRRVLADCEAGVPLHRMAILHGDDRIYAEPLRDVLAAASLPATVIGGRPLADSHAARGLLGLLRLRSAEFSRMAVVTWLASFPRRHPGVPDGAVWDRLSRRAGVVCGADSWQRKMARYAAHCRAEAAPGDDNERSAGQRDALTIEARNAEAIGARVVALDAATAPPPSPTWSALSAWARRLLDEHVVDRNWAAPEQEAAQVVAEILAALPQADALESSPTVETLIDTLERLFESRHRPEGRLGAGLVVGTPTTVAGMSFDRVHILGLTESAFPSRPAPDPFLPALGPRDPFDDREDRLGAEALAFATVCAGVGPGGVLHLSTTIWDESDRQVYPSRWFVAEADALAGNRQTSARVRVQASNDWMEAVPSPLAGLLTAPTPLNLAERRLREGAAARAAGRGLQALPMATRTDLPLRRSLAIRRARRSAQLTAADGNLADFGLDADLGLHPPDLALDSSRLQSATQLQQWAECPFRFFLDRVLRVEATELPEDDDRWSLSPLNKGSAVHRILERLLGELVAAGRPRGAERYTASDRSRLHAIADEEFAAMEADGLTGHPLVWTTARAGILADLDTFLQRDASERATGDWRPDVVEQHFGYQDTDPRSWAPLAIPLPVGTSIHLRGQIDRVDLAPSSGAATRARVIDYKTGSAGPTIKELEEDEVRGGTALQLALYARAVQAAHPELTTIEAAYWFVSTKGAFTLAKIDVTAKVAERLDNVVATIGQGIAVGAFPQVPGGETFRPGYSGWDNCVYCAYTRICPSGRDSLHARKADDPAAQRHGALALPVADDA